MIFVTGRNKRAIEDHFDANKELENVLHNKGMDKQADMVESILPKGVECVFVRQSEQLGLGHAVICAERVVGSEPFAVLLADDFITDYQPGMTKDLVSAYEKTGNYQLCLMEVNGAEIANYGVILPGANNGIAGLIEKPDVNDAPSNLASIGRYVFNSDIFDILRALQSGLNGEIQLANAINLKANQGIVEGVTLKGVRFDCGTVDGYVKANMYEYSRAK